MPLHQSLLHQFPRLYHGQYFQGCSLSVIGLVSFTNQNIIVCFIITSHEVLSIITTLGENMVLHSPPRSNKHYPQFLKHHIYKLYKKKKWVCQYHGIFQLLCTLIYSKVLPLHLDLHNGSVLEHCFSHVQDALRFGLEFIF